MLDGTAQAVAVARQATTVRETTPGYLVGIVLRAAKFNKLMALDVEQNIGGDKEYPSVLLNAVSMSAPLRASRMSSCTPDAGTAASRYPAQPMPQPGQSCRPDGRPATSGLPCQRRSTDRPVGWSASRQQQ